MSLGEWFRTVDVPLTRWMARYGIVLLRISLGLVFLWFGALKYFPGMSPAQTLATRTMGALSGGLVTSATAMPILATWECLIGLGLILGRILRVTLLLLWAQMLGTIAPLFLYPQETFLHVPYAPTLEGQYILKNLVLITASIVIGATVRGGQLIAEPRRRE
jgi:uncharacterized membrane protein YkgB